MDGTFYRLRNEANLVLANYIKAGVIKSENAYDLKDFEFWWALEILIRKTSEKTEISW